MKLFAYAVAALAMSFCGALAEGQAGDCKDLGDLAEKIMEARQLEIPVSTMLSEGVPKGQPEAAQRLIREVILAAYDQGAMRNKENQARQRAEFRNDIEMMCYRGGLQE